MLYLRIQKVNATLSDEPGIVNSSPEKDGWMIRIKASDQSEIDSLMDSTKYKEFIENIK